MSQTVSIATQDQSLKMVFYPQVGGSFGSLTLTRDGRTVDILRPYDSAAKLHAFNMASFPMVPMCGRTDHGKFAFEGKTYRVGPPSEGEPHPNHGNGRSQPWTVTQKESALIEMVLQSSRADDMPHSYTAQQKISLSGDAQSARVLIEMSVRNDGSEALPFGLGHHLYFARTPETLFGFKAGKVWQSEGMIPRALTELPPEYDFSTPKTIDPHEQKQAYGNSGTAYMDHCFTGYGGETIVMQPEHDVKTVYRCEQEHFISFIPSDAPFICCFAPSNMPDGFNRFAHGEQGTGTVVLAPGEVLRTSMTLEIS